MQAACPSLSLTGWGRSQPPPGGGGEGGVQGEALKHLEMREAQEGHAPSLLSLKCVEGGLQLSLFSRNPGTKLILPQAHHSLPHNDS